MLEGILWVLGIWLAALLAILLPDIIDRMWP